MTADTRPLYAALAPIILVVLAVDALLTLVLEVLYLPTYLGAVAFPLSALIAGAVNVGLVYAAGTVSDRAGLRLLPLLVWTLGFLICATSGPGGDVLLGSNWQTLLLLFCGLIPPMIYVART
ncbi:hypothetical protein [Nocardia asteroides]|uniref:hypothetical protein n=1 Tax=Nocardia asteroides TaxID=1824 RepID=UPI001E499B22|nr:hypothetical protein [Nocardia asteroides]UGT64254.1 hypothetical protein LTT61_13590 [Nocardia asteroides]